MPVLSTTPVQVTAPATVQNTGAYRIYFDRQSNPTRTRHIGHIEPGASYTTSDDIYLVALDGDTSYSSAGARNLGGGEIAHAEYLGVDISIANNQLLDVPGAQIIVPAHSGPVLLRAQALVEGAVSAANGWMRTTLIIKDVEANATLKSAWTQGQQAVSGGNIAAPIFVEERIVDSPTPRTFSLQVFANWVTAAVKLRAPGSAAANMTPFIEAIAR